MASRKTIEKIRREVAADQARYDEVTRRLEERIERGLARTRQRAEDPRRKTS